jgi:FAD/FMN-containing dehydrogenase
MNSVTVESGRRIARTSGGALASDVVAVTDPLGVAPVAGSAGAVGFAGLTLGGGYGALIGRFGLALDNLLAAEVVLADGRVVVASPNDDEELFWALRGGGGNFGVVTALRHLLHDLPSVHSGMVLYPFSEAKDVLEYCTEIVAASPEELTAQFGLMIGPNGAPVVLILPTWSGSAREGEARVAPFLEAGTLLASTLSARTYGDSLTVFDPYLVNGRRTVMETCWLPCV